MKKIDNWLSIQRYITEASKVTSMPLSTSNVEVWGKVQSKPDAHYSRKTRRFLTPVIKHI
jgi:hypothetical protein